MIKKNIVIGLNLKSILLFCLIIINGIYGQDEQDGFGEIDSEEDDPEWQSLSYLENLSDAGLAKTASVLFPERFCLFDENVSLSPTHSAYQGGYGTCWAFATIHALEIETKKKLLNMDDGNAYSLSAFNINLSERQLISLWKKKTLKPEPEAPGHGAWTYRVARHMMQDKWVIPLEGDNCYTKLPNPYPISRPGQNEKILPPAEGFSDDPPTDWSEGVYGDGTVRRICWLENESAIKYSLYDKNKGVICAIHLEKGKDYLGEESSEDRNHSVVIVGWNDNAQVADRIDGKWVTKSIGKAWIVKNSHGKTHYCAETGKYENWFYMKYECANAGRFFCLSGEINFVDECATVNRFYKAEQLDCNNDNWSNVAWCGNTVRVGEAQRIISGGKSKVLDKKAVITITGYSASDGSFLAAGEYVVDRYEITFDFKYNGWKLREYLPFTRGTSPSVLNSSMWMVLKNINESEVGSSFSIHSATGVTYVYYVHCLLSGPSVKKYYPCTPEQASIGIMYKSGNSYYSCNNRCAATSADLNDFIKIDKK